MKLEEVKKKAWMIANEKRKAAKAVERNGKAKEREIADEEFCQAPRNESKLSTGQKGVEFLSNRFPNKSKGWYQSSNTHHPAGKNISTKVED